MKKDKQSSIRAYIICLNPNCSTPQKRCLSTSLLHKHPPECSHHFYPAQEIMENWNKLSDYPNDVLGKAVEKKLRLSENNSYFRTIVDGFREKINKLLDSFEKGMVQIFPYGHLQNSYDGVYNLSKIAKAIKDDNDTSFISKVINGQLLKSKLTSLFLLNERYDELNADMNSIYKGLKNKFNQIIKVSGKNQKIEDRKKVYEKKINLGLLKSKFIASSKITCQQGLITFPTLENVASFLPWLYTDTSFSTGTHQFRICSQRFPVADNCGFTVLEEHDIDTYPYHYFKSLFSKEGRGFELTGGSEIQYVIGQTTTVILKINLSSNPQAQIYDSERRSTYVCNLQEGRRYRLGIYGSGWSLVVMELN